MPELTDIALRRNEAFSALSDKWCRIPSKKPGTLEQSFKSVLRRNKAGGVDRIARTPDFTTKIRQAVVSQSRYHIEG